jgi:hypothetical protein
VRGQAADKLLLGHDTPVLDGRGDAPKIDRRVTRKAPTSVRRIDGSGRSETSPATIYSLFTANRSIACEGL